MNLTDKDAGLLNTSNGGFIAGYNAQSVVATLNPPAPEEAGETSSGSGMIITAVEVTPSSDDHPQLIPMIEASAQNTGLSEGVVTLADAGYHSGANLAACDSLGYRVLIPETTHHPERLSPYHKDRFIHDPQTDTYRCPEGKSLSFSSRFNHSGYQVRRYRAQGEVCRACPAFRECTNSIHGRTIKVSVYEPLLQRPEG